MTTTIDYAQIGKQLLHPVQAQILAELHVREKASPSELSIDLDEPLSNVSYHMRVLAGISTSKFRSRPLVQKVGTRPVRGALENFYALV
jgi:DNA-binding transcriptional ArsR family regulator